MHICIQSNISTSESKHGSFPLLFSFHQNKLLIKKTETDIIIPTLKDLELWQLRITAKQHIGIINGYPSYTSELAANSNPRELPACFSLINLRSLFGLIDDNLFWAAGRAFQIMNWNRNHSFCSRCGSPNQNKADEIAKICPACGFLSYPTVAPAIIVAVIKDNQILLARNKQRPFKFYSLIAGFVEAGESLEDCVRREVQEEVGIKVKNISYFKSQPWPFPNSLMIGFTAEYESGEIRVDNKEISHAAWFTKDNLPEIPGRISIAWHLIQWFINNPH
ncbi:MAG: NAD(+) diphosphatase [Bacillota bacterium]|jgi:NAD+ diphosphatase|nr:NAD(+) diphosphatase [Clostridia bacterium]